VQFIAVSNCVQSLRAFDDARLPAVAIFIRDCVHTIAAIDRMASFSTVVPNVEFSTECEYKFATLRHILKSN